VAAIGSLFGDGADKASVQQQLQGITADCQAALEGT
jgi:hypothetical protein